MKTKTDKPALIPRLRFPEFQNSGEWEVKELGKLCDITKGEQLNKTELTETGKYPCLNGGIYPSGYTEKFNTEANTITISEGGNSCGYVNFIKTNFWLGGHCYKLTLKSNIEKIWQIPLGSLTVLSVEKYISILSILIAGANIISHLHFSNLTLFWDDDSDTLRTYPNTFVKSFLYSFS